MITVSAQLTFDGEEELEADLSVSFSEFRRVSVREEGLVTASQAADILGVSKSRIGQLGEVGAVSSWSFWGRRYYSLREVGARRVAELSKGGRPRSSGQKMAVAAKLLGGMTAPQVGVALLD